MSGESFGPVAPIVPFDTEAGAVTWANDTIHGPVGDVYTGDLSQGMLVAEAMHAGKVAMTACWSSLETKCISVDW